MLSKLLKYDLKYMMRNMSVFYILAFIFAILTRIFFSLEQTLIIKIITQISLGCMFSMVGSILFNTLMRSWVRFRDFLYKDEAYLTHTLPVTKKEIYKSKLFQVLIFTMISLIIMLISLFITYYTYERWELLKNFINKASSGLHLNTWFIVISVVSIFFLEILNIIQCGFLGIILGYKKNNNKLAYSFLYGFISYMVSQAFVVVFLFIAGLFNNNVMSIFTSNVLLNNNAIKLLITLAIIIYIILIILISVICSKVLEKGVNVE